MSDCSVSVYLDTSGSPLSFDKTSNSFVFKLRLKNMNVEIVARKVCAGQNNSVSAYKHVFLSNFPHELLLMSASLIKLIN